MAAPAHDVVALAQALIRLRTAPGAEGPALALVRTVMTDLGYDRVTVDDLGNVIGTIEGARSGCLVLDGHVDVVSEGDRDRWTHDPWGGGIDGGFLYGRGATDMKGAVAAMVVAGARLAAETGRDRRTIHVSCTIAEELVEGLAFGHVCDRLRPDAVVIGEPTNLTLAIGQRGRGELCLEVLGRAGHSAYPETAINALEKMLTILPGLLAAPLPPPHAVVGPALLVPTEIISSPYPSNSVVPERCRVTLDRRLLPGETPESVLAPLREYLAEARRRDPALLATIDVAQLEARTDRGAILRGMKFAPGWALAPSSRIVEVAQSALAESGLGPCVSAYLACTNGSAAAGERGIPTIGFGPGDDAQSHQTDEHISITALEQAVDGYAALARYLAVAETLA